MMKQICIVSFSSHKNGNCESIARFIQKQIKGEVKVLLLSQLDIHGCGRCLYECFDELTQCPYIHDDILNIYHQITMSDFCFMIVPNYSDAPCANYFMFRERSQCTWALCQGYYQVRKHWIVVANTCKENFPPLLVNEIEEGEPLHLTFVSSQETKTKSTQGHLIDQPYYQNLILTMLKEENLI